MYRLAFVISFGYSFLLGLLLVCGARIKVFSLFPFYYSYLVYLACGTLGGHLAYWLDRRIYPSVYWLVDLGAVLAEFLIIIEISDRIFQPFPAIRNFGRGLTILLSITFGVAYILPAILLSRRRSLAVLDFTMRASFTKAVILVVLFCVARHYGVRLGKNVGGVMVGFSIYVAVNVANMACAMSFGPAVYGRFLWVLKPLSSALCLTVWAVYLWKVDPASGANQISLGAGMNRDVVARELARFNEELSSFLHR